MIMALAMPIASPTILMAEKPLLRQRLLPAILKKFLNMGMILHFILKNDTSFLYN
jgi:hypothetical protein